MATAPDKTYPNDSREAQFIDVLARDVVQARNTVKEFIAKIAEDPGYWMGRAMSSFEAAATIDVFSRTIDALTKGDSKATWDTIKEFANREVMTRSRNQPRSSSPTSNLMDQELLAAWSHLVDKMGWFK